MRRAYAPAANGSANAPGELAREGVRRNPAKPGSKQLRSLAWADHWAQAKSRYRPENILKRKEERGKKGNRDKVGTAVGEG